MDTKKAKLIFIHDFGAQASSWDRVIDAILSDSELDSRFEAYRYSYASPWSTETWSIEQIATDFGRWLEEHHLYRSSSPSKTNISDHLYIICHGQGTHILFHLLKNYFNLNEKEVHNGFLRRIREIILFSTHFNTYDEIDRIRLKIPSGQKVINRQKQEDFLAHLEIIIDEGLNFYDEKVMNADNYIPDGLPIATVWFYGQEELDKDNVPHWFFKELSRKIPGNRHTLINFDSEGEAFAKLKFFLLNPIGHPHIFEVEEMNMNLSISPLKDKSATINYGQNMREIFSENIGSHTKTVRFSMNDVTSLSYTSSELYTMRYGTTAPGGGIVPEYAPVKVRVDRTEEVSRYEKEGKEFNFNFFPLPGEEYRLSVDIYKGFDGIENQSTHFHLGRGSTFYRHIRLRLDLSNFPAESHTFLKNPEVYFFDEDKHHCADTPKYRIPEYLTEPVFYDETARRYEWEFFNVNTGVIDMIWKLIPMEVYALDRPNGVKRVIKIFLASSSELKEQRQAFQHLINEENIKWAKLNIWLELIVWEKESDAMSRTSSQDEYNKLIPDCDMFVGLFYSKLGKYTREEYNIARGVFEKVGKPNIHLYFKDAQTTTRNLFEGDQEILEFIKELRQLGHFNPYFKNNVELKKQFRQQIKLFVESGKLSE